MKKQLQRTLYHRNFPELERKKKNYVGYAGGNRYKPKELPPPNCEFQQISLVNTFRYCGKNRGGNYCIFEKGHSGSAFECPIGIPRIFPMVT